MRDFALLWRRLVAIGYDALLLAALWMVTAMAVKLAGDLAQRSDTRTLMQLALFGVGMLFFAWFWSHGGQTLGMRVWRLRVERAGGGPVANPAAMLRYVAGALPVLGALYGASRFGSAALTLALIGYAPCFVAGGGRAFNDLVAGTRLVLLPKASAQQAQAP